MKGVLILLVTAIVVCVGHRTQGVHKHRHGKTGHKPERDTGSITLKPGTTKNKLFPGYGTNFRYIGEVKNGLDRVTVVTSIPIPKYSDIELRPIVFNNFALKIYGDMEQGLGGTLNMKHISSVIGFWLRQNFIKVSKRNYNFCLDNF